MAKDQIIINDCDRKILKEILQDYNYKFYVYGSRSRGSPRTYSDIDLFCYEKISDDDFVTIKNKLEESDLTITVDLLDSSLCDEEFIEKIRKDFVEIK
jgi:predicted nucleotidyltransferase